MFYLLSALDHLSRAIVRTIRNIERFSVECRKTKTTLANHNRRRQSNEPIKSPSKYMHPAQRAGKRVRTSDFGFERQRGRVVRGAGLKSGGPGFKSASLTTSWICNIVVPSSNPWPLYVYSQLVSLPPVGILNTV